MVRRNPLPCKRLQTRLSRLRRGRDRHDRLARRHLASIGHLDSTELLGVEHDDRGDQRVAGADPITLGDVDIETLATVSDGVDADV